jgi:hypothetical protein
MARPLAPARVIAVAIVAIAAAPACSKNPAAPSLRGTLVNGVAYCGLDGQILDSLVAAATVVSARPFARLRHARLLDREPARAPPLR